jgi:hypothetical protein
MMSPNNPAIPKATYEPTRDDTEVNDSTQVASKAGIEQVTNILDNASSSGSPQSNTFSGKLLARWPDSPQFKFLGVDSWPKV